VLLHGGLALFRDLNDEQEVVIDGCGSVEGDFVVGEVTVDATARIELDRPDIFPLLHRE